MSPYAGSRATFLWSNPTLETSGLSSEPMLVVSLPWHHPV
jgi:hypothetical protein